MAYHNNGLMVKYVKDLVAYWDYDKNNPLGLDPGIIPVNSSSTANWKCPNGHSWEEEVGTIYRRKNKCLCCSGRIIVPGYNDLKTLYPEVASEWDYDSNSITPDKISPKDTNTYFWKCKNNHPRFERSVEYRVRRLDPCPYCSGREVAPGYNDLQTLFPKLAKEWDTEGNNGVLPSEVSYKSGKPYMWICPRGHHYKLKLSRRINSTKFNDCTKCNKSRSTSFPEQAVYYYTKKFFSDAISRWRGLSKKGLELDIYIPSWNIGIEYDGNYSHSSSEAKDREKRKYEICKSKRIKLIRIKEEKDDNSFNWLADEIYYIKKRPTDDEMNNFLFFFFGQLTRWSNNDPNLYYKLPLTINIKRDRQQILEYLIDVEKSFGKLYPELAKNWDDNANGKLTPYVFTPGSNYDAHFICERCGEPWHTYIHTVVKWKRTLCKKCSMGDNGVNNTKRIVEARGSLGNKYKEAVEQWDNELNGDLTPFDVPVSYSKDVNWKCPVCTYQWSASPNSRIHNNRLSGCPHCVGREPLIGVDDLETLYPDIAKEWDFTKNKGVFPSQILPNNTIKRYWVCSKHNRGFKSSSYSRIRGSSCEDCKKERIKDKNGFRVEQYNKKLEYIRTFASLNEAGDILNTSPEAIRQAVLKGTISNDSYWKYEGTDFSELKPDRKHPIVAIDVKESTKVEYESAREAERQTGIGHTSIMKCCKKVPKYKTAGGFYWYFKGEEPVS